MKLFTLTTLVAPVLVAGQGYNYPPVDTPSTSASGTIAAAAATPSATPGQHIIQVGLNNGLMFSPTTVTASANDTVTFVFPSSNSFNHSVTQSTFANPCTPVQGGFNSGLQSAGTSFSIQVTNASAPIWFYCEQTTPLKHCGMGMVGAINAPSSGNTFQSFSMNAVSVGNNEGPQTASPALSGIGAVATAPAGPISSSGSGSPTSAGSSAAGPSSSGPSTNTNGAGRISIGAGVAFSAIAAALYTLA